MTALLGGAIVLLMLVAELAARDPWCEPTATEELRAYHVAWGE